MGESGCRYAYAEDGGVIVSRREDLDLANPISACAASSRLLDYLHEVVDYLHEVDDEQAGLLPEGQVAVEGTFVVRGQVPVLLHICLPGSSSRACGGSSACGACLYGWVHYMYICTQWGQWCAKNTRRHVVLAKTGEPLASTSVEAADAWMMPAHTPTPPPHTATYWPTKPSIDPCTHAQARTHSSKATMVAKKPVKKASAPKVSVLVWSLHVIAYDIGRSRTVDIGRWTLCREACVYWLVGPSCRLPLPSVRAAVPLPLQTSGLRWCD